jgi:hypothetical protein
MVHEAHTDHGSVLRPDQFAIAANADGTFALYVPQAAGGPPVSRSTLLLAAVAAKLGDEDWVADMIRDLELYR